MSTSKVIVIPKAFLESFLKSQGLGGLAGLPTKLAMFVGAEQVPEESRELADELAAGEPMSLLISCGSAELRFEVR